MADCAGGGSSVCTLTVFVCWPLRSPMFKVATISPFSPGLTTSFCVCVVVQPHDAFTDLKCTGVLPTFSYLKCATAVLSPTAGCASTVVCSHFKSAADAKTIKIDNVKIKMKVFLFSNRSAQSIQCLRLAKSDESLP